MREILLLAEQLEIDGPVLLLMAREASEDYDLRTVDELNDSGRRALLMELRRMNGPMLLAA
jgi:hypothetical protein